MYNFGNSFVEGISLTYQNAAWDTSVCSVSGGELYVPCVPEQEDRIKDLFYQHQVNAAWSEYGERWLNGSKYSKM